MIFPFLVIRPKSGQYIQIPQKKQNYQCRLVAVGTVFFIIINNICVCSLNYNLIFKCWHKSTTVGY